MCFNRGFALEFTPNHNTPEYSKLENTRIASNDTDHPIYNVNSRKPTMYRDKYQICTTLTLKKFYQFLMHRKNSDDRLKKNYTLLNVSTLVPTLQN